MNNDSRIILLDAGVDELSSTYVILQLLYFNSLDETKPIYLYIDSPGGSIVHGLAIYDTIKYIKAPVYTVVLSMAASMGAFLLSCGEKRSALRHSLILIHQPRVSFDDVTGMKQSKIDKMAKGLIKNRQELEQIMAENVGVPIEKMHEDCEHDYSMTAEEALKYGFITEIIDKL